MNGEISPTLSVERLHDLVVSLTEKVARLEQRIAELEQLEEKVNYLARELRKLKFDHMNHVEKAERALGKPGGSLH